MKNIFRCIAFNEYGIYVANYKLNVVMHTSIESIHGLVPEGVVAPPLISPTENALALSMISEKSTLKINSTQNSPTTIEEKKQPKTENLRTKISSTSPIPETRSDTKLSTKMAENESQLSIPDSKNYNISITLDEISSSSSNSNNVDEKRDLERKKRPKIDDIPGMVRNLGLIRKYFAKFLQI